MDGGGIFIDWLSMCQQHDPSTSTFVGTVTLTIDAEGEIEAESGGGRSVEGSYSTVLRICSHRGRVRVSGNPARYGRPDNLVGFDLDESVEIFNRVLATLGLPQYARGTNMYRETADGVGVSEWSGATFSRIDLTRNYETGSDSLARLVLRDLAGRNGTYMKKNIYGEETAMWHNTHVTVKAYRKGPDMALHCKESPWIDYVEERGVVRHEVAIKSRRLGATGLRYWGNCDMGQLIQLFEEETEFLAITEIKVDAHAVAALTPTTAVVHAAWSKGVDIRAMYSKAQFARHRRAIKDALGVDILQPQATILPLVRRVDMRPLQLPAAYWQAAA